jgi:hypothetical protein
MTPGLTVWIDRVGGAKDGMGFDWVVHQGGALVGHGWCLKRSEAESDAQRVVLRITRETLRRMRQERRLRGGPLP